MTDAPGIFSWKNHWFRRSVLFVAGLTLVSLLVGFVWLPSQQGDFSVQGIWSSICSAAGVPRKWGNEREASAAAARTTSVVLTRSMAQAGTDDAVGLGATIALQCTICHGARGVSDSDAPSLAGQHPEVIVKQLTDYRNGDRINSVMQAFAKSLSTTAIRQVAAYYAELPRGTRSSAGDVGDVPTLVRAGDSMRNIAPCSSCHEGDAYKLGAPRLEGMSVAYLTAQLTAFTSGRRHNDSHSQMRNMARRLSPSEITALATYYARP